MGQRVFDCKLTRTPEGVRVWIKSAMLENLAKSWSTGRYNVECASDWKHVSGGPWYDVRLPRIPSGGLTLTAAGAHAPAIQDGGPNLSHVFMVGMAEGTAFVVRSPMTATMVTAFATQLKETAKFLLREFAKPVDISIAIEMADV